MWGYFTLSQGYLAHTLHRVNRIFCNFQSRSVGAWAARQDSFSKVQPYLLSKSSSLISSLKTHYRQYVSNYWIAAMEGRGGRGKARGGGWGDGDQGWGGRGRGRGHEQGQGRGRPTQFWRPSNPVQQPSIGRHVQVQGWEVQQPQRSTPAMVESSTSSHQGQGQPTQLRSSQPIPRSIHRGVLNLVPQPPPAARHHVKGSKFNFFALNGSFRFTTFVLLIKSVSFSPFTFILVWWFDWSLSKMF